MGVENVGREFDIGVGPTAMMDGALETSTDDCSWRGGGGERFPRYRLDGIWSSVNERTLGLSREEEGDVEGGYA